MKDSRSNQCYRMRIGEHIIISSRVHCTELSKGMSDRVQGYHHYQLWSSDRELDYIQCELFSLSIVAINYHRVAP